MATDCPLCGAPADRGDIFTLQFEFRCETCVFFRAGLGFLEMLPTLTLEERKRLSLAARAAASKGESITFDSRNYKDYLR